MFTGLHCGDKFPEGITNGAWWYPVLGMYAKKNGILCGDL
jgi:hypothetical protein